MRALSILGRNQIVGVLDAADSRCDVLPPQAIGEQYRINVSAREGRENGQWLELQEAPTGHKLAPLFQITIATGRVCRN